MTSPSSTTAATAEATPTVAVSGGGDDATPKAGPQQGDVQRDLGRKDEALSTHRRAIEIVGDRQREPELFGSLLFAAARLTWDHAGDAEQARALAERALGLFTDVGEPSADSRAEVDAWLAAHPAP